MARVLALMCLLLMPTLLVGCAGGGGGPGGGGAGSGADNANGNPDLVDDDPDAGSPADRGCAGDPPGTRGANGLPNYGLIPAPVVPRFIREGERPAEVDLSEYVPTPCSQGALSSCLAWATSYGLATYLAAENIDGWVDLDRSDRQFSPTFIFNQANAVRLGRSDGDSCSQAGIFATDALVVLRDTGCATWQDVPYTVDDCQGQPGEEVLSRAADFKIGYFRSVERDVATMQSYLEQRIPVVVVLWIDEGFNYLAPGEILDTFDKAGSVTHGVLVVGYDDGLGAIKVLNSWGTEWGDGGFGFISYEVWESMAHEAYVVGRKLVTPLTSVGAALAGKARPVHQEIGTRYCADNPLLDSDGDGYPDTLELEFAAFGLDPLVPDDNPDLVEFADADADGWPNETETVFGTNSRDARDFPFDCDYQYPDDFFDDFTNGGDTPGGAGGVSFAPAVSLPVSGSRPYGLVLDDFDGDGHLDLAVSGAGSGDPGRVDYPLAILTNDQSGNLVARTTSFFGFALKLVGAADLDGDGQLDLLAATAEDFQVFRGNGDGSFGFPAELGMGRTADNIVLRDLNRDGTVDLAGVDRAADEVYVALNNGDGSFAARRVVASGLSARSVAAEDLDGDDYPDLAVISRSPVGGVVIFRNDGQAVFADSVSVEVGFEPGTSPGDLAVDGGPLGVSIGDLDGDGDADLAVPRQGGLVTVLLNNGALQFELVADVGIPVRASGPDASVLGPYELSVADFDGDGRADLGTVVGQRTANQDGSTSVTTTPAVLLNGGDGTVWDVVQFPIASSETTDPADFADRQAEVRAADLDDDGRADLIVESLSSDEVYLLVNIAVP
ncbi:MAG TPA: FG-GAP-like repeat-containing protein [Phycisphaerae bacterium]|nr:FG-GAP-like repeat-containing protein [Phycisphaerae bacterium]